MVFTLFYLGVYSDICARKKKRDKSAIQCNIYAAFTTKRKDKSYMVKVRRFSLASGLMVGWKNRYW